MMMKKNKNYICPNCGEDMDIDIYDYDYDSECLCEKICCNRCEATWREFFLLKYDGYAYDNKIYNADGDEE